MTVNYFFLQFFHYVFIFNTLNMLGIQIIRTKEALELLSCALKQQLSLISWFLQ